MINRILNIISVVVLFFLVGSCSIDSQEIDSESKEENVKLKFILSLGDADLSDSASETSRMSRAVINNVIGTNYENKINVNQLYIYIYCDNNFIGELKDVDIFSTPIDGVYDFVGSVSIPADKVGRKCKIKIFANIPLNAQNHTLDNQSSAYSAIDFSPIVNNSKLIPMWGVKTVDSFNPIKGGCLDIGTINILRAFSKVEVKIDDKIKNQYRIGSATLTSYATNYYYLPNNEQNIENLISNSDNYFNPFNISSNGSLNFYKLDDYDYVIYVPEYRNSDAQNKSYITLNLIDNNNETVNVKNNKIQLKNYSTNAYFNLVRNNSYTFNITSVSDNIACTITCKPNPWEVENQQVDFQKDILIKDNGMIRWTEGTYKSLEDNVLDINYGVDLECKFTILSPQGAKWYAFLIPMFGSNSSTDSFSFDSPSSGFVGQEATLRINPNNSEAGDKSKLCIVVKSPDGRMLSAAALAPNSREYIIERKN